MSDAAGDTLTVPFYGEGITVMGRSNTDCGKIEVYLDGQLDKTVDLYSFEETNDSCSLYQKKGLPLGDHTLTIKHVDGRNYATGNRVVINQFNLDVPAKGVLVKGDNLLLNKPAEASNYYKNNAQYGPSAVVDGNQSTRWATDDNVSPITITFDLQKETAFNYLVIMEAASFANRVSGYQVEAEIDGEWKKIAEGGGVGANLGVELPDTIATKLRIEFTMSGAAGVTLSEVELYQAFYEEESAQSVADDLCVYQPAYGASSVTTSVVPEGYKVDLISSSNQKVVALDGTITTPTEDTEVTLTYRVTKTADGSTGEKTDTLTVRAKAALTAEQVAKC